MPLFNHRGSGSNTVSCSTVYEGCGRSVASDHLRAFECGARTRCQDAGCLDRSDGTSLLVCVPALLFCPFGLPLLCFIHVYSSYIIQTGIVEAPAREHLVDDGSFLKPEPSSIQAWKPCACDPQVPGLVVSCYLLRCPVCCGAHTALTP